MLQLAPFSLLQLEEQQRSWEDEHLDEEMEEIFHPASDQFCLKDLSSDTPHVHPKPHFDETDYQSELQLD